MTPAFSAIAAANSGLRLIWQRPRTLVAWGGVQVAFLLSWVAINVVLLAPSAQRLRELNQLVHDDPGRGLAQLPEALPGLALVLVTNIPLFLFFSGLQNAAILRAFLKPAESRFAYLRLGRDELNIAVTPIVYWLVGLAYLFVVQLVINNIQNLGGAVAGRHQDLVGYFLVAALAVALIYPAVRLSLALPATLAQGRIRILQSWRLTSGHFWPLLGAYALVFIYLGLFEVAAALVSAGIAGLITITLGGGGEPSIPIQALIALILLLLNGLTFAATFVIWRGPSAHAYLALEDRLASD